MSERTQIDEDAMFVPPPCDKCKFVGPACYTCEHFPDDLLALEQGALE